MVLLNLLQLCRNGQSGNRAVVHVALVGEAELAGACSRRGAPHRWWKSTVRGYCRRLSSATQSLAQVRCAIVLSDVS